MAKKGFHSFGVDYIRNKSKRLKGHILHLDLTKAVNQKFIMDLIRAHKVAGVRMAPPCGTASRASDRPLSADARKAGLKRPAPLRSEKEPLGFKHLQGSNKERVAQANQLYEFCAAVAAACTEEANLWIKRSLVQLNNIPPYVL